MNASSRLRGGTEPGSGGTLEPMSGHDHGAHSHGHGHAGHSHAVVGPDTDARRLGIGRSTLYRKLSDLGIESAA